MRWKLTELSIYFTSIVHHSCLINRKKVHQLPDMFERIIMSLICFILYKTLKKGYLQQRHCEGCAGEQHCGCEWRVPPAIANQPQPSSSLLPGKGQGGQQSARAQNLESQWENTYCPNIVRQISREMSVFKNCLLLYIMYKLLTLKVF